MAESSTNCWASQNAPPVENPSKEKKEFRNPWAFSGRSLGLMMRKKKANSGGSSPHTLKQKCQFKPMGKDRYPYGKYHYAGDVLNARGEVIGYNPDLCMIPDVGE